jgi:hypothetical protein
MSPDRLARLPNWPARMGEEMAADMLGVSQGRFREKWQAGEYPQPIREGRRLLWARIQLERFVLAQFNLPLEQRGQQEDTSWDDV